MTNTPEQDGSPSAPRRPRGLVTRLAVVASALVVGGAGTALLAGTTDPPRRRAAQDIPALQVTAADVDPGTASPRKAALSTRIASSEPAQPTATSQATSTPQPQASDADTGDPLSAWADRTAPRTGIPPRALWAYGNAELVLRSVQPDCHLSWATLAGIGRIESNHGRFGGATLEPDGRSSKPIVGVPLNGSGAVTTVGDTDGGAIDGDPRVDRAVGPMQFIPSTWRKWASDAGGDGTGDVQQIDDAALGAARYLCAGGRDMATPSGWWSGVLSYNRSVAYGQKVFGLADTYARAVE